MILYFSGTGNTRHVALSLSNLLDEKTYFIPSTPVDSLVAEGERVIFVFPVYSWGVPPLVADYVRRLPERFTEAVKSGGLPVLMVCTCGDETGMAPEMFERLWQPHGIEVRGEWSVIMPNDYVLLPGFDVDKKDVEQRKLQASAERIRGIAHAIMEKRYEKDIHRGSWPRFKTNLLYPWFQRWGMNPERWYANDDCISCGRCAQVCPVGNIAMQDGKPCWGKNCVSCTACFHHCPTHAVTYGRITPAKGQYYCQLPPLS